jgi:excisionase family DNA binding protein
MPLLGYKDAANELGLPIGTLYSLVSRRRIPHVRLGRRLVRFDQSQLVAWVAKHRVAVAQPEEVIERLDVRMGRDSRNSAVKKRVRK